MPAYAEQRRTIRPRERAYALAAVAVVQAALGFALLTGLRVPVTRPGEIVSRLIDITIRPPPPQVEQPQPAKRKPAHQASSAPKAEPKPLGGSPGPKPAHAPPSVTPVVAVRPTVAPPGGGTGTGPALGSGAGGGTGGPGYGARGGGSESELIAGDITLRDYPRHLGNAGIGGRVEFSMAVGVTGRVTRCMVTRSSGVPELDALTCRLVQERFRFRPATDRYGRPVTDQVEGDFTWE